MHEIVESMLAKYACKTQTDYQNAIKEIIQEIALLGLWRAKFFEKAAFYGGTALRILYQLNRFSEDMDFSLLASDKSFSLDKYNKAVQEELESFGFITKIETKQKNIESNIQSAFIKADTKTQLIYISAPSHITLPIHHQQKIKIKMEVDIEPPAHFSTETKTLLQPIPFTVNTFVPADLLAGKIHAILCRNWQTRVKGRDWYDLIWYVSKDFPLNLKHLQARLEQSGHWEGNNTLTHEKMLDLLYQRIEKLDVDQAKEDVMPFLTRADSIEIWSKSFFEHIVSLIKSIG